MRASTPPNSRTLKCLLIACAAVMAMSTDGMGASAQVAPSRDIQAPSIVIPGSGRKDLSIDVEVTDKLGHNVRDLSANEFTLLDDGSPVKLTNFAAVTSNAPTSTPVRVIIVIDAINAPFTTVARMREQLGEFLAEDGGQLAHPTSIAVLSQWGLKVTNNSSTDGKALLATLNNANGELRDIGRSAGIYGAADRLEWSVSQLAQLAAVEATKPGRKLMLFISPGWPLLSWAGIDEQTKARQWTFDSIVSLTNGLRDAHITVSCISPYELGRGNPFYYQTYLKAVPTPKQAEYPDLALQVIATHTGGVVQTNGYDILGALNTAIRDAGSYYTLTFEGAHADHLNEYHALQLKVDKPGVKVRTTYGYYAQTQ
jgi:VWFA-related protein